MFTKLKVFKIYDFKTHETKFQELEKCYAFSNWRKLSFLGPENEAKEKCFAFFCASKFKEF
ncbi:MAG: hypothetical protein ABFD07_20235 [Methanobacterium sp.]